MSISDIISAHRARYDRKKIFLENQRKEAISKIPGLADLQDRKKDLLLAQISEVIKRPAEKEDIQKKTRENVKDLDQEIRELVEKHGADVFAEAEYECQYCRDTGYVDGAFGKELCSCLKRKIYTEAFNAEDPRELEGCDADFNEDLFKDSETRLLNNKIRQYIRKYAAEYPNNIRKNVVFIGNAGLGKSFMLSSLAKLLLEKEEDVLYIRSGELFELFLKDRLGEKESISYVKSAKLLFIDDLGTESVTQNVTVEYFFDLVDKRGKKGLPILIATNLNESELKTRYGERTVSRLLAEKSSDVIHFKGEDLRLRK